MKGLPSLLDAGLVADVCRETAAEEGVQPQLVEKDLHLTRLLWLLGEEFGDGLLLKGGTLLSKVDLGFFRMSEDADLVIPGVPSHMKMPNVKRLNRVRGVLKRVVPMIGLELKMPAGELSERGSHAMWMLEYPSEFGHQGIRLEISIRPVLTEPRAVTLQQLIRGVELGDHINARCWALSAEEARAEKVRAAFTREAIRDFYDLDRLLAKGADFLSHGFTRLVDQKLAELKQRPLMEQPPSFGLTPKRRRALAAAVATELRPVLRQGAPEFELEALLDRFDRLWGKRPSSEP